MVCEEQEEGGFVGLGPFGRDTARGNAMKENDERNDETYWQNKEPV
jgi:hypothetical protein